MLPPRGRSTTVVMPILFSGRGPIKRCVNGLRNMLMNSGALAMAGDTRLCDAGQQAR